MANVCLVRCEYSATIGMGHLVRCQALAARLKNHAVRTFVLSSAGAPPAGLRTPEIEGWIGVGGAPTMDHDADRFAEVYGDLGASFAILDMYGITLGYQQRLAASGVRWLQFDGAAAQRFRADLVLSISPRFTTEDYVALAEDRETEFLVGPRYAILREEVVRFAGQRRSRTSGVSAILLSFGGGDDRGAVRLCLQALESVGWSGRIDIVLGSTHPDVGGVRRLASGSIPGVSVTVHSDPPGFVDLLVATDLAIISGGMTTFEAAAVGVPFLMIQIAENQRGNARAWDEMGVAVDLGELERLTAEFLGGAIMDLARHPDRCDRLSARGQTIVDGGGTGRVVEKILERMALR